MMKPLTYALTALAFIAILALASTASALYPTATPWPMYRHDVTHSGTTTSDAPSSNSTLWTHGYSTYGLSVTTTPLVIDGRVIFTVRTLAVAVDETTGVELWRHDTPSMLTAPSAADGRVFFGMAEGTGGLLCLNASTGSELWMQDLSPYFVSSSPLIHDGIVYAGLTSNHTRAFTAATGHYEWGYKTGGPVYASPAADGDVLFFGSSDTQLYALNVSGPTPVSLWNFTANGPIRSTPTVTGDRIIFGSDNHTVFALNKTTGQPIWSWTTTDTTVRIRNGVAVADNIVYVTPESTSGLTADMGNIHALHVDVAPGNYTETDFDIRYWKKQFPGYQFNEPVYANGTIIITSTGGEPGLLLALDADVGTTLWDRRTRWWPSMGTAVVADDHVWFNAYWSDPGSFTLYCLGDPFPPSTTLYNVNAGGSSFVVALESNSTPTSFNTAALETERRINFTLHSIGITGMCNFTLPDAMLSGPFNVTVNGEPPLYLAPAATNGTHTALYFTYNATTPQTVEITGTTVIPEFPATTLAIALAPLLLVTLVITILQGTRRRRN
jgi:outer membrane protein assembly factor BamB